MLAPSVQPQPQRPRLCPVCEARLRARRQWSVHRPLGACTWLDVTLPAPPEPCSRRRYGVIDADAPFRASLAHNPSNAGHRRDPYARLVVVASQQAADPQRWIGRVQLTSGRPTATSRRQANRAAGTTCLDREAARDGPRSVRTTFQVSVALTRGRRNGSTRSEAARRHARTGCRALPLEAAQRSRSDPPMRLAEREVATVSPPPD
jgi:hypothetical protein